MCWLLPFLLPPAAQRWLRKAQGPLRWRRNTGCFSAGNVQALQDRGIDPYIAVGRDGTQAATPTEARAQETGQKASMREKLSRAEGKGLYSRRKVIVEPVFPVLPPASSPAEITARGWPASNA